MDAFHVMLESLKTSWNNLSSYLPQLLAAVLLLIVGWVIAKILRRATIRFLRALRLDAAAEKAGIEDFLLRGGIRYTAVTIVANLVYWFIFFTVILAALHTLGLPAAAQLLNEVVLYIPHVIVAVLLLLLGTLLGRFVRAASYAYLNNLGVEGADLISHIAQWAIMIFVFSVALEQLSIGGQILISAFQIAFGAFCLSLALAFGLGGRRWAAHILDRLWRK